MKENGKDNIIDNGAIRKIIEGIERDIELLREWILDAVKHLSHEKAARNADVSSDMIYCMRKKTRIISPAAIIKMAKKILEVSEKEKGNEDNA